MGCCENISASGNKIIHGAVGLAKSMTNIGIAEKDVIERRRAICRACPKAVRCKRNVKRFCTCSECGCSLKHKTRLKSESCPLGKWGAEDESNPINEPT